jgi:transposase
MVQVTARLPDALGAELDAAAQQLNRCRADIIRQAIEYYLDDIEDLRCGVAALIEHDRHLQAEALALACHFDHPVYECLVLALAQRLADRVLP